MAGRKNEKMNISIIIPTYNEAENIDRLINYLVRYAHKKTVEIIVVDAASKDETITKAKAAGAITAVSPQEGRAAQMNYGAYLAKGDILYFIHADSFPPKEFLSDIETVIKKGYQFGRYRTKFQSTKWILQLNAFFTRFDWFVCYGGDQTLFITKSLFEEIGGFDVSMQIMEDYDIVTRAKQKARYGIIQRDALVSARKYDTNSWWRVQRANYLIVQMFKKGASQEAMVKRYKELLDYR